MTSLSMMGCSLKNRFDRSSTLAYHFANQQSRLQLNLDVDGPKLSDPSRLVLEGVSLRFTHKFQAIPTAKEKCRYASPVQGIFGSLYNEIYLRDTDTVFEEIEKKFQDF